MIDGIIMKSESFKSILSEVKQNLNSQAFLFHCSDELTAFKTAFLFCKSLFCEDFCESCDACLKLSKEHSDFQVYPKDKSLKVQDSNLIVEESFVKPIYFNKKVFLIKDFDNSTPEAQNKLLKVLEEPNKNVYFVLTTSNLEKVLPTIKSRCSKIKVQPFSNEEIEQVVKNKDINMSKVLKRLGNNYLGKVLHLDQKKNFEQIFTLAKNIVCEMKSSKDVIFFSKQIIDVKEDFSLVFECVCLLLEELIFLKTKRKHLACLAFVENQLTAIENDYSLKAIGEIMLKINDAKKKLFFNTNFNLVVDNLLLNILEVKYLCK